jgi:hypothetical protein
MCTAKYCLLVLHLELSLKSIFRAVPSEISPEVLHQKRLRMTDLFSGDVFVRPEHRFDFGG